MTSLGPYELDRVHHAEALAALARLPEGSADLLLTDPPYSSGGFTRGDRQASPRVKYQTSGTRRAYPSFDGDSRDQRGWTAWCMTWLAAAKRALSPGALVLMFSDWRMLPSATDAIQGGGFVWRGVAVWDKPGARPVRGRPSNCCEFIVWGTNGPRALEGPPHPGLFRHVVRQADKHHLTGKPTPLMRELVRLAPPSGLILDPFAGSGTTGVAAVMESRRFLGFELSAEYADIANRRIREARGHPKHNRGL